LTSPAKTSDGKQSFSILSCSFDLSISFQPAWVEIARPFHRAFPPVVCEKRLLEPCAQTAFSPVLMIEGNFSRVRAKPAHISGHLPPEAQDTCILGLPLVGFKTTWRNNWDLDQIIDIANSGKPIIVGFPSDMNTSSLARQSAPAIL
jgi:hypothetical protein